MRITHFTAQGQQDAQAADLPDLLAAKEGVVWVDMSGPSEADVQVMRDVFKFHPLAIEDTRNHQQRPKIEEYPGGYRFIIVNTMTILDGELNIRELDIFMGRNYIVTVHEGDAWATSEAHKRVEYSGAPASVSYLLYTLLDVVVDGYFPVMDEVEEEIDELEDTILTQPRQQALNRVFELKRMLLDMWRVVWPERDILSTLSQPHILGPGENSATQFYLRDVADHLFWIADMVGTFRDTLTSIIDLYMSAVSNRLNRVINRLTVITMGFGLLAVITGFYGMNFEQTWPPFGSGWGVPFVLVVMAAVFGGIALVLWRLDSL